MSIPKPSKAFIQLLFESLESERYKLVKSRNTLVQKFEYGTYNIVVCFAGRPLLHLDYDVCITFDKIKNFILKNKLTHSNKYTVTKWNLAYKDQRMTGLELKKLYDENYKYTLESLNQSLTVFHQYIKPLVDDFKSTLFDYKSLYEYIAIQNPMYLDPKSKYHFMPNLKKVLVWLILIYNFNKSEYENLFEQYYEAYKKTSDNELLRTKNLASLNFLKENMLKL